MYKILEYGKFIERLKMSNRIFCYGAGKMFSYLEKYNLEKNITDKIEYVVDQCSEKWGEQKTVCGHAVAVISPDKLTEMIDVNDVILITCLDYFEVVEKLEQQNKIKDIDIFVADQEVALEEERRALAIEKPEFENKNNSMVIPKVIHYCWFGGKEMPDNYKYWMESWRKYCPDYEIKLWNEDNYDVTKNKYMYDAYKNGKWGFVPDYARLDIIYEHGGIYLDTDVELINSMDDLLNLDGFIGFEREDKVNLGVGFGARPKLEILKYLRDQYEKLDFVRADGSIDMTPSPDIQTQHLISKGLQPNGQYQIIESMTVLPEKYINAKSVRTRRTIPKEYTKAIHHYDGSWVDERIKKYVESYERDIEERYQI